MAGHARRENDRRHVLAEGDGRSGSLRRLQRRGRRVWTGGDGPVGGPDSIEREARRSLERRANGVRLSQGPAVPPREAPGALGRYYVALVDFGPRAEFSLFETNALALVYARTDMHPNELIIPEEA